MIADCCQLESSLTISAKKSRLTLYAKISTKIGFRHIDVLNLYMDIVDLMVGLLGAFKLASGAEKGASVVWK